MQVTGPAAVCSGMIPAIPDEILLEIGNRIVSESTLAALCQVSQHFNGVFTPLLYSHIWVNGADSSHPNRFPEHRLRLIRQLTMGRMGSVNNEYAKDLLIFSWVTRMMMMDNLQSVMYVAPRPSKTDIALLIFNDSLPSNAFRLLQFARDKNTWAQGIHEVTLTFPRTYLRGYEWELPALQNLQCLHLHELPERLTAGQLNAIA